MLWHDNQSTDPDLKVRPSTALTLTPAQARPWPQRLHKHDLDLKVDQKWPGAKIWDSPIQISLTWSLPGTISIIWQNTEVDRDGVTITVCKSTYICWQNRAHRVMFCTCSTNTRAYTLCYWDSFNFGDLSYYFYSPRSLSNTFFQSLFIDWSSPYLGVNIEGGSLSLCPFATKLKQEGGA